MSKQKKCQCRLCRFARLTNGTKAEDYLLGGVALKFKVRKMALEIAFREVKVLGIPYDHE